MDSDVRTLKVERGLTPEGKKCIECHAEKQPGIVADWKNSRHGHVNVSCIDCHGVFELQQDLYELQSISENRLKNGKIED